MKTSAQSLLSAIQKVTDTILAQMQKKGFYFDSKKLRFDPTTWDINNGYCEEWAEEVSKIAGGEVIWLDEYDEDIRHCVLFHNNKYYDAECWDGVADWRNLPLVKNQNKSRAQVLAERAKARIKL